MTDSQQNLESRLARQAPTLHEEAPPGKHYLPPDHVQLLEKLEHLSRYSHFIQIVEAVPGAGKSTLAEQFSPDSDDNSVHACFIKADEGMDASELLSELVEQLRLEVSQDADEETLLQAILEHAELLCDISRLFLIIVDDAECLTEEALDLLLNQLLVISNPDARPHLVFFATPKLRETLNQPQFQPVFDSNCHFLALEPLDAAALDEFVHHSFPGTYPRLSEKQFKRLLNESFGLPGRIPRVLKAIEGGNKGTATKPESGPKKARKARKSGPRLLVLSLLATLMAISGGVTWLLYSSTLDSGDRLQLALPVPVQPPSPEPEPVPATLSLEQKLARAEAALIALQPDEPAPVPTATSEPVEADAPAVTAIGDQLPAAPVRPEPEQPPQPPEPVVVTSPAEPAPKKKLVLTLPAAETAMAPVANPQEEGFLRERELLSWKPSGYTLQVLGARKERSVIDFISGHRDNKELYYFSTNFKGKPWYVVVYGQYRTRELAMQAIAELPPELRERRPWARSVKGVQDDIRRPE